MSKHHLQGIAEQITNTGHGSAPFHHEKSLYQTNRSMGPGVMQKKLMVDDSAIQLRAYQIYQEKGGSDLDNWLEAERSLNKKR